MSLWLALGLFLIQQDAPADTGDDIVVTARPRGCDMSVDGHVLSDADFDAHSRAWAATSGKTVRVRARADADVKCLSRIAFRLASQGVSRIVFVDPSGRSSQPPPADTLQSGADGVGSIYSSDATRERDLRLLEAHAARLILEGKCDNAQQLLLQAGDLRGAADAIIVCQAK